MQFECKNSKLSKPWFSSIWPIDRTLIRCYHSGPEWIWEWWQQRSTPHSPKLQHYWNFNIRLLSVISRILVAGVLPLCREAVGVYYSPSWRVNSDKEPSQLCIVGKWLSLNCPTGQYNGRYTTSILWNGLFQFSQITFLFFFQICLNFNSLLLTVYQFQIWKGSGSIFLIKHVFF